jgi:hypothetical protein
MRMISISGKTSLARISVLPEQVCFNIVLSTIAVNGSNYTGKYRPAVRHSIEPQY